MPKGKYTAADVAPDNGSMPNAGPMGEYSAADVADAPPVEDDDPISRFFQGAGNRIKGMAEGMTPQGADEIIGGPGYKLIKGAVQGAKGAYDSAQKSAEEGDVPGSMLKSVAAAVPLVGPGAASVYDRAKSGDTAGAMGMGGVDALAMLLPTKGGKVADAAADAAAHPMVRGAGRVVRDFDITKPFKSIGDNVVAPAAEKLSQMRAARGKPTLQSPLDPSAGVRVQGGAPVEQPRIPSPAEDMVSSLEQGQSEIPIQAHSMQPTADMTSGGGGANYSADDLANLISKHNIPPAPGEVVGGTRPVHPNYPATPGPNEVPNPIRPLSDALDSKFDIASQLWDRTLSHQGIDPIPSLDSGEGLPLETLDPNDAVSGQEFVHKGALGPEVQRTHPPVVVKYGDGPFRVDDGNHRVANALVNQRPIKAHVAHLPKVGWDEVTENNAILEAMREDLDAHGRNALHEESTDFAARNKVDNPKIGKPGYGWKRKLPEAE